MGFKPNYKVVANLLLSAVLLTGVVFSVVQIAKSAALDPGHAWDTLDDAALPVANGGTGQTSAANAFDALAPSQTGNSGKYLTTDASNASWGITYATSTRVVLSGRSSASLTVDSYCHPQNHSVCVTSSNATVGVRLPFAGTIRNFYAYMQTAPAAGGNTAAFTVRKAASCTDAYSNTALTCTITGDGSDRDCTDTANSASAAAGSCLQIFYDVTGTIAGLVSWSFELAY